MPGRAVGGEVDQRRVTGRGEVAALHALGLQQRIDLGASPALDDRDVRSRRAGGRRRQHLEHLAVGHVLLEVVRAGAQVAALAGERRAQVEEEARGDHAGARELDRRRPGGRMRRDRDRDARRAASRGTAGRAPPGTRSRRRRARARAPRRTGRPTSATRDGRARSPPRRRRPARRRAVRPAAALAPAPRVLPVVGRPLESVRHPRAPSPRHSLLAWLAGQPALQQVCRGPRVLVRPSPGALRQPGREALVVELDRDRQLLLQPRRERASLGRLRRVPTRQRQRQTHDHALDLELGDERAQARESPACRRGPYRFDRGCKHTGGVADRATAPRPAVIERKHAHDLTR